MLEVGADRQAFSSKNSISFIPLDSLQLGKSNNPSLLISGKGHFGQGGVFPLLRAYEPVLGCYDDSF